MSNTQQDEFSYFQTGSGLPLAGATVQVVGCQFLIDNSYMAGATVCAITMKPLAADGADLEPQTQMYSVGKKHEAADFGARAVHESGKDVRFNNQSNYGKWIDACMRMEGAAEFIQEARVRGIEPNIAGLWIGMWFELGDVKYTPMGGGDEKALLVPIKYLGASEVVGYVAPVQTATVPTTGPPAVAAVPGGPPAGGPPRAATPGTPGVPATAPAGGPPAAGRAMPPRPGTTPPGVTAAQPPTASGTPPTPPSAPSAPAAAPPAAPVAAFSGTIAGVDQSWTDWLIGMAAANTDFDVFIEQVMTTDGVTELALVQQAAMSKKDGSLWATHHG